MKLSLRSHRRMPWRTGDRANGRKYAGIMDRIVRLTISHGERYARQWARSMRSQLNRPRWFPSDDVVKVEAHEAAERERRRVRVPTVVLRKASKESLPAVVE